MRFFTLNPIKAIALAVSCFIVSNLQAATYTAVASGWYSMGAIWQGGIVPSINISIDTVIIPAGITVKLNQNMILAGSGLLRVNGTLSADTAATDMVLSSGLVTGSGVISVDSLEMDMMSGFEFTGTVNINKFATTGTSLNSGATFNVADTLYARANYLLVPSGMMNIADNVLMIFMGGYVDLSTASNVSFLGRYNVLYRFNGNLFAALELTKPELKDIEIDVPTGASVTLNNHLNANGVLNIKRGILDLNKYNLTIGADGYVAAGSMGHINAEIPSSLTINSTNTSPGTLNFTASGNVLKTLVLNMANNFSDIGIGTELNIADTLYLQSGRLFLNNNELIIGPAGHVSGGSSSSYVVPGQAGSLRMTLTNGVPQVFMVGTAMSFAPAMVMPNNVPSVGTVGVTVHPAVFVNSTGGEQIGSNQPVVNATWYVTGPAIPNVNIYFEPMWSNNMEVNGFDRQKAYVGMYAQGRWDTTTASAAMPQPNGLFSLRRNNIKRFGAFAVLDQRAKTTEIKKLASQSTFSIYPNPVADKLNVILPGKLADATGAIYDASGRVLRVFPVVGTSIETNNLPAGKYQLQIKAEGFNATRSFLKL